MFTFKGCTAHADGEVTHYSSGSTAIDYIRHSEAQQGFVVSGNNGKVHKINVDGRAWSSALVTDPAIIERCHAEAKRCVADPLGCV